MRPTTHTPPNPEAAAVWAAFDFDGTLTRQDTLLPFLRQVLGTRRLAGSLLLESPWLGAYFTGLMPNDKAKEHLLRRTLAGISEEELHDYGRRFAEHGISKLLRPPVLQRLREHQTLGHRCALVTASPALYTRPWAENMGFTAVIATELAFDADRHCLGTFLGGNCYGPEKTTRLQAIMPPESVLYAYGDSYGDRELLAIAQHAFLIGQHNRYGATLPELPSSS